MISEDSASPFFAFSCSLAAVLAHHPLRPERWNVGRPRKPGAASWVCFLTVFTPPTILRGVVFSGVNLMALGRSSVFLWVATLLRLPSSQIDVEKRGMTVTFTDLFPCQERAEGRQNGGGLLLLLWYVGNSDLHALALPSAFAAR